MGGGRSEVRAFYIKTKTQPKRGREKHVHFFEGSEKRVGIRVQKGPFGKTTPIGFIHVPNHLEKLVSLKKLHLDANLHIKQQIFVNLHETIYALDTEITVKMK